MSDFATPLRWPTWLGRLLCRVLPHRWLANSGETWRVCSRCRIEQTYVGGHFIPWRTHPPHP